MDEFVGGKKTTETRNGQTLYYAQNRLKEWGIEDKDGKLVQTNPKGLQITPTVVKDMSALEKQIEKDKKNAAKEVAGIEKIRQQHSR